MPNLQIKPIVILLAAIFLIANSSAQEVWETPRTAYDAPDLQGIWSSASITTLERDPALGNTLSVGAEEARRIEASAAFNVAF